MSESSIIAEAAEVFALISRGLLSKTEKEIKAELNKDHREFCSGYFIVLEYMFMNMYDVETFRTWLNLIRVEQAEWKDDEKYFKSHANYSRLIMRKLNPEMGWATVEAIADDIFTECFAKHKEFGNRFKEATRAAEENEARLVKDYREEFKRYALANLDVLGSILDKN
jgi:hypothetical protein